MEGKIRKTTLSGTTDEIKTSLALDLAQIGLEFSQDAHNIRELVYKLLKAETGDEIIDLLEEYRPKMQALNMDFISISKK